MRTENCPPIWIILPAQASPRKCNVHAEPFPCSLILLPYLQWGNLRHLRWPVGDEHRLPCPWVLLMLAAPPARSSCGMYVKPVCVSPKSLFHSTCWQSPLRHRYRPREHREYGPAWVMLSWTHVLHWHHGQTHRRHLTLREVIPLHTFCVRCLHLGHLHASLA